MEKLKIKTGFIGHMRGPAGKRRRTRGKILGPECLHMVGRGSSIQLHLPRW